MTEAALYATVWLAVACFVTGEAAKTAFVRSNPNTGWPWIVWASGACLLAIHMLVAIAVRHGWSHASIVRTVEAQTQSVYGVGWGIGVWANYAFLALWLAEAVWWRVDADGYFARPRPAIVLFRVFSVLILVNAVVVFAAPSRRALGAILMVMLVWAWRDTLSMVRHSPQRAGASAGR